MFGVWPEYGGGNGNADIITTRVDRLTFSQGLSKVFFWGATTSSASICSNFVHVVSADHENLSQVLYHTSDFWYDNGTTGTATDRMLKVKFDDLGDHAIGGVIPWMVGLTTKRVPFPPSIDENGYLYHDMPGVSATIAAASSDVALPSNSAAVFAVASLSARTAQRSAEPSAVASPSARTAQRSAEPSAAASPSALWSLPSG